MPSTHSASIGYIATATILACAKLPIHESLRPESLWRAVPLLVVPPWSVAIMMSRVWLGHHTWPQVFVGAGYGIAMAWIWYMIWTNGLDSIGEDVENMLMDWVKSR
jgi:dolichyldiphosphatase